mgnify:FL=1
MEPDAPDGDLSDTVTQIRADVRAELERRNAEHGTLFSLQLSEADALDLASGYVPQSIQAAVLAMLDWRREDERRAARPVRPRPRGHPRPVR